MEKAAIYLWGYNPHQAKAWSDINNSTMKYVQVQFKRSIDGLDNQGLFSSNECFADSVSLLSWKQGWNQSNGKIVLISRDEEFNSEAFKDHILDMHACPPVPEDLVRPENQNYT